MLLLRPLLTLAAFVLALAAPPVSAAPGAVVTTPQVRAELVVHAPEGLGAGRPMALGLLLRHQPGWHSYWKNPGDSGLPTTFAWTLPEGAAAGDIRWPTPQRLPVGPLMNFGYDGTLLLPVPLSLADGFKAERLDVTLHAEWLVCKEVCIPESGDFVLSLPREQAIAAHAAEFAAAEAARPVPAAGATASARIDGQAVVVEVQGLPADWQGAALDVLPATAGALRNAAVPQASWSGSTWTARLEIDAQRTEAPPALELVLVRDGVPAGLELTAAVAGAWPPVAEAGAGAEAVAPPAAPPADTSLALALALAFGGGLLLNLMPCVFPVLSLKVLGFAAHAHDRAKLLAGGLAYTLGVVVSFVALAGLLLALRAGGEQLGWGFQLQQPGVVAALALLFTLIGLNLAGVFEFGSVLPSSWAAARARHPLVDSLLTGVLAVAVASPCTAPFMGASLGVAVTLPPAQALTVFAALGLGMAAPYLLASAWPRLAGALPRPGVWMAHFKVVMAFPMFATVVWLVWVLGQQTGIDGAAALLALLVALAFAAWAFGSRSLGVRARTGFGLLALALFGATLAWALPAWREAPPAATAAAEADWQPWSAERAAQALAEGKPVFVDFTAAWCVTCQVNKRTTLARDEVLAEFRARGVVLLRADWTRRDAAITAELARLGRSGVPVYALYTPGGAAPRVLSEILSPAEVREMLAELPAVGAPA
ncbi:thioredoxin family protein [Rubrivivax sp. JA1024]|nr:thioredoxin family protein [Rubrivivax sp. JA1024]